MEEEVVQQEEEIGGMLGRLLSRVPVRERLFVGPAYVERNYRYELKGIGVTHIVNATLEVLPQGTSSAPPLSLSLSLSLSFSLPLSSSSSLSLSLCLSLPLPLHALSLSLSLS